MRCVVLAVSHCLGHLYAILLAKCGGPKCSERAKRLKLGAHCAGKGVAKWHAREASSVGELKQLKYATIYEFMSTRLCTFRKKYFFSMFWAFSSACKQFCFFSFLTPVTVNLFSMWSITALVAALFLTSRLTAAQQESIYILWRRQRKIKPTAHSHSVLRWYLACCLSPPRGQTSLFAVAGCGEMSNAFMWTG